MSTKRKLRRVAHQTSRLKSKGRRKKDNFLTRLANIPFPKYVFLKGVLVVTLGGAAILGYRHWRSNYAHKTWHPGNETWKAAIYAPQEEMDSVDKAIWLGKENICRYSIDDLKRMNLQPDQVYYIVSHQLRVEKITPEHLQFYLNALDTEKFPYTTKKKVFFPLMLQGHECQFLDTLLRCGVRSDVTFKVKGEKTSLLSILWDEIKDFPPEHLHIINSDPSWIISAFVGANPTPGQWSFHGEDANIFRYITYSAEKNPETGRARYLDFACQGLHFLDALSRLYWYYGQYLEEHETIPKLQGQTLNWIKKIDSMNESLNRYSSELIPTMEKFREEPTQSNFEEVFKGFVYLGHSLELILEPEGYYRYNFPLTELEPVAKSLSEAIVLWYTPEFDSQRKLLDIWDYYDDSEYLKKFQLMDDAAKKEMKKIERQLERYTSMAHKGKYSIFTNASLLHACHGLMRWQEYKQQEAEKPVESVSSSAL